MTLANRFIFWLLVRRIQWIGGHVLKDGDQLTIWRENDRIMHAVLGKKGDKCQ